ncbi:MAG: 4-hydroxy-tetrahydrodipicolinate reductase [Gemmatimonadota bacterium]|nr:MAG: 4-hydroxy-tetrahydrodipicolinate reductase [Gemmatimonadota bacterium]
MKIALIGYGRMGRAVEQAAASRGHEVVARIDVDGNPEGRGITAESLNGAEVAVEFTVPEAAPANIAALAAFGADTVSGTTGWYDRLEQVRAAVEGAGSGLIYAPNFSLGMQLFFRLARLAGRLSEGLDGYDAYVLEAHHRHKKDHPSGTARRLAEILLAELSGKERWELGPPDGPIDPAVLQVTAVRAGEIPGTHTVGLDGPDDRIELCHEARGRAGFARGALAAAEWIRGRSGIFTLDNMLAEKWT